MLDCFCGTTAVCLILISVETFRELFTRNRNTRAGHGCFATVRTPIKANTLDIGMRDLSAHHLQRGDVTAIVWGAPGERYRADQEKGSNVTAAVVAGAGTVGDGASGSMRRRVDAEELTRGRRAAMPFVQQCDLVFPLPGRGNGKARQDSEQQLEAEQRAEAFVAEALGTGFYYRVRGPLSSLLSQPFLGECVLKGGFSALAFNAPSDQGNSFAVLPSSVLLLSLDRESFQTLGLPGEAMPTRPKGKSKCAGAGAGRMGDGNIVSEGGKSGCDRYVSAFDLSSKAFRPGKPLYDRLMSCLRGSDGEGGGEKAVDMVVCSWDDGEGDDGGGVKQDAVQQSGTEVAKEIALVSQGEAGDMDIAAEAAPVVEEEVAKESGSKHEPGPTDRGERTGQRRLCCREIKFPPSFSVEKIELKPDLRFFREACCPDLDFVGQGLARTRTTPGTSGTDVEAREVQSERPEKAGRRTQSTAIETDQHSETAPPLPESTKCRLILDMFEWLGAVSCELESLLRRDPSQAGSHLSEFETPRHVRFQRHRTICRARLRGLLPPLMVSRCVEAAGGAAAAASSVLPASEATWARQERHGFLGDPDGCSWGSVMVWPFRDAPRSYPGADAPCAGGGRMRRGSGAKGRRVRSSSGDAVGMDNHAKEWPVGGQGVYTVVACPFETAAAFVSARCPGPGW